MPRGGYRENAGRKPGSKSRRTIAMETIAAEAIAEGVTPLEVMLAAMRAAWEAKDYATAEAYAKDAAPYVHPRRAAVNLNTEPDGPDRKDLPTEIVIHFVRPGEVESAAQSLRLGELGSGNYDDGPDDRKGIARIERNKIFDSTLSAAEIED